MAEAGYGKGQDGFYLDETGSRMTFEITGTQSPQNASERSILADGWRKLGLDTDEAEFAGQEIRDGQRLATFRSMYSTGSSAGIPSLIRLQSDNISGPENRWTRSNRGGWSDPDYDRMATAVQSTLDRAEQGQRVVEALRILTAQAGIISLYFNPTVVVFPATIRGMRIRAPESEPTWNVADWEFAAPYARLGVGVVGYPSTAHRIWQRGSLRGLSPTGRASIWGKEPSTSSECASSSKKRSGSWRRGAIR